MFGDNHVVGTIMYCIGALFDLMAVVCFLLLVRVG